ncbi:MAG: hypothetical protein A2X86_02850 [Bdellovibrionales bacterium GWA2_49_15]|nr:MAG: hypothetical protein A2X86_02850 [Bdellovibrionales bacterium GWA2_49_15]HAZ14122.1 protoporphyrinogen oxidase [Bdellovibrionales bacterium]
MSRFLIVYGTKYGQAEKISKFALDELTKLGHIADVFDAREIPGTIQPEFYDAAIVGGSVHMYSYPRPLIQWVKKNHLSLSKMPSAFFSVSLGIMEESEEVRKSTQKIVNDFFKRTDWHPKTWSTFAGALAYSQYSWPLKLIMRWIAKKAGAETNLKQDYEYTNWNEVRRFIQKFAELELVKAAAS